MKSPREQQDLVFTCVTSGVALNDESAADVWIAFIEVPPTVDEDVTQIHLAKELAEK